MKSEGMSRANQVEVRQSMQMQMIWLAHFQERRKSDRDELPLLFMSRMRLRFGADVMQKCSNLSA